MLRFICSILLFSLLLSGCSRKRVPNGKVSIREDDGLILGSFAFDNIRVRKVYHYPHKQEYLIKGTANALKHSQHFPDSLYYMILVQSRNSINTVYPNKKGKFKIRLSLGDKAYFTSLQENMYINNITHPGKNQDGGIWTRRFRMPKYYYPIKKERVKIIPLLEQDTNYVDFEVLNCKRFFFRKYKPTITDSYDILLTLKVEPDKNEYQIVKNTIEHYNSAFAQYKYNGSIVNIWMNRKDTLFVERVDSIPVTSMKIFID